MQEQTLLFQIRVRWIAASSRPLSAAIDQCLHHTRPLDTKHFTRFLGRKKAENVPKVSTTEGPLTTTSGASDVLTAEDTATRGQQHLCLLPQKTMLRHSPYSPASYSSTLFPSRMSVCMPARKQKMLSNDTSELRALPTPAWSYFYLSLALRLGAGKPCSQTSKFSLMNSM